MEFVILLNSILRLPLSKGLELHKEYQERVGYKNFYEQQRVLDLLAQKNNTIQEIKEEAFDEAFLSLAFMVEDQSLWGKAAYENIKNYPMVVWIECIGAMKSEDIMKLLSNFSKELPSSLIETCIINLPEDMQVQAIQKYKNKLDPSDTMFSNFYYSVSEKARFKLKEYFPEQIEDDVLLELQDVEENILVDRLSEDFERLIKLSPDDLIEFILLKSREDATLNVFFKLFMDKINECSIPKFELLFTRYKYLRDYRNHDFDEEKSVELLTDRDLFQLFKNKFHQIGIESTLSLFDKQSGYHSNKFTVDVVLEFMDIAYSDVNLSKYSNEKTVSEIITKFVEKCNEKDYAIDDFTRLVKNLGKSHKTKLTSDDYIEAIIACGKLLKNRVITDQHPLFLELRKKFSDDLLSRCEKDGTYLEDISLHGLFYRLAKGSIPFDKVYMTQTYKGLIFLSKCGEVVEDADYITKFLTDEQLVKLNITPAIRWKNMTNRKTDNNDYGLFIERMGLQLLLFFGYDRGRYLLESNMQDNRMESLFDGLKYENVSMDEKGNPKMNEELMNFLFGRGRMLEAKSVINQMIRGEIPVFEKYFTEFCNSFWEIKESLDGVLSVKRIVRHFEDIALPIELKPDELGFKHALMEMNTLDQTLLSEAIGLCKDARNRGYSSIPKVEGQLGNFTYQILDLDDPMAIAVGYLSHCCFKVGGISYSSLKHSMQSRNGRTFVVYYKGSFLTQSWVWRNGDVICFDSVESGSPCHEMYEDDIQLVNVYKKAANQMLQISHEAEDNIQKVKVVTVGKSDYQLEGLEKVKIDVPMPLENRLYIGDSSTQQILAGAMPETPRYGVVGVQYRDSRKKVAMISDINHADADTLDEATMNINSLRYQIHGEEQPLDYMNYKKIISGDGWYILIKNDGSIESGVLDQNEETKEEYNTYLSRYTKLKGNSSEEAPFVKKIKPLIGNN